MSPLSGDLTFSRMREWLERADELAAAGPLDLGGIDHADSSGVAYLLELTRRANAAGRDMAFTNVDPELRGLLEFLQVDGVLKLQG